MTFDIQGYGYGFRLGRSRLAVRTYKIPTAAPPPPPPPPPPEADIIAARIIPVSSLDPDTGSPSIGIDGNGWLLELTVIARADAPNGPDFTKVHLINRVPGFDNNNGLGPSTATTWDLDYTCIGILRRQADGNNPDITENTRLVYESGVVVNVPTIGAVVKYYLVLEDFVYDIDIPMNLTVDPGWYGAAASGSGPAIINESQRRYQDYAQPIWGAINCPEDRIEANSFRIEYFCQHRHAMRGQGVAAIIVQATDGTNDGPILEILSTSDSQIQTQGPIEEVFGGTLSLVGINNTNGSDVTGPGIQYVKGKIRPWRGVEYDMVADGIAWPTSQCPTPLRFVKDTSGLYGGAVAYVFPGATGNTVLRSEAVNYANAIALAFPDINSAAVALQAFNNQANNRPVGAILHNNVGGGSVELLAAANGTVDQTYSHSNITQAGGNCWFSIKNAGVNTTGKGFISSTAERTVPTRTSIECYVSKDSVNAVYSCGDTTGVGTMLRVKNMSAALNLGTSSPWLRRCTYLYQYNVTYPIGSGGPQVAALHLDTTSKMKVSRAIGVIYGDANSSSSNISAQMQIGCVGRLNYIDPTTSAHETNDGGIIDNCKFFATTSSLFGGFTTWNFDRGFFLGQYVLEIINTGGGNLNISSTNASNNIRNFIIAHATHAPTLGDHNDDRGPFSIGYREKAVCRGAKFDGVLLYSIGRSFSIKSDYESMHNFSGGTGNVGNYAFKWGVGSRGLVQMITNVSRPIDPAGTNFMFRGFKNGSAFTGVGEILFVDNNAMNKNWVAGDGFGDYNLLGPTSLAKNRVPANWAIRKKDLYGNLRLNDGTGAAGCAEATF